MGKISQSVRMLNYHKVFSQMYESPVMSIYNIAVNAGLSRNTVSKYLQEMYTKSIVMGPQVRMKPAQDYKEYVYLMNFRDPYKVFKGLKGFPHVLYHAMTFGDWNTIVVTNRLLDFSKLTGFRTMVKQGTRGHSYTPLVQCISWNEAFKKMHDLLEAFTARTEYKNRRLALPLDWEKDEWKLFHTFKYNMRKKVTPALQKIKVRYEIYMKWMKTLETHCTIHTGFYPEGYRNYLHYCFLFHTDYQQSVKSLFSLLPTTPFIMELDNQLLIFASTISPDVTRTLFCLIYDMKTKRIIKKFSPAVVLFHWQHEPKGTHQ